MEKKWYCIYTKPNKEAEVIHWLSHVPDVEVFYPKILRKKSIRGRWKDVTGVLFPCYVFMRFDAAKYYHMIKYLKGVKRILGDEAGSPYIVDNGIIELIQSRIKNGFVYINQPSLNVGDQVVIQDGPLDGLKGIFVKELRTRDRVLILLNTIMYQPSIEVEKGYLRRSA